MSDTCSTTCSDCQFFNDLKDLRNTKGVCNRYPPKGIAIIVQGSDWCGEHEPALVMGDPDFKCTVTDVDHDLPDILLEASGAEIPGAGAIASPPVTPREQLYAATNNLIQVLSDLPPLNDGSTQFIQNGIKDAQSAANWGVRLLDRIAADEPYPF